MKRRPARGSTVRHGAERSGRWAEGLAALYLRLCLYRILETRFRTPVGEIDIIAARFGTLVFIEVKMRGLSAGEAEALDAVNTRRIGRAAALFLARHPELAGLPMRFDVIFVAPFAWPRHHRNAFTA